MENIPILVDGPNYVNRVLELGIHKHFVASQLSGRGLISFVNHMLSGSEELQTDAECQTLEFICSQRNFGPSKAKFTNEEQDTFLKRLGMESGVFVELVTIPGSSEKGVDSTIQSKLEDLAPESDFIVLVSHDRDFIPVLHKLRHKTRVICIAIHDNFPAELGNEAYHVIHVGREIPWLFTYQYPWIPVDTLTLEECADLYANADDRKFNQVRITNNGYVYIECEDLAYTGNCVARFETSCAYNGYVGPVAASQTDYIQQEFDDIAKVHREGLRGYFDYHP